MNDRIPVLDHGYIQIVESWGSDERIIEAARMSTGKGFLGWGPTCEHCAGPVVAKDIYGGMHCSSCGTVGGKPGDEKLLKFLWDNHHATPFEMAGAVFEVQAPIAVYREWHRHRTQCLAPETEICCVTPGGSTIKRTIQEIHDLKHGGVVDSAPAKHKNGTSKAGTPVTRPARRKNAWRTRILPNCQDRTLRVLDETTLEFTTAPMASVWESGVKKLFRVVASSGRSVRASAEHPFFTRRGWVKLKDLLVDDEIARMGKVPVNDRPIPPALREGIGVWTTMMRVRLIKSVDACYLCGTEYKAALLSLDHVIPVSADLSLALEPSNLRPACTRCHRNKTNAEQPDREGMTRRGVRWERLSRLPESAGEEMTYDIEVNGPHHNYVANDFVVHNSYNEMSARYTALPDVNYIPTVERLMVNSKTNKQAGTIKDADELTIKQAEMYRQWLANMYTDQETLYRKALQAGVPKELARMHIGVGRYSRMRASAVLRNWLAFLTLRMAPGAQWEIRQYANAVHDLLAERFPRTLALFDGKVP